VSHPHEILRLKVPAVVAIPVLKNGNGYVEMRKHSTNSTSFSTFHMTSKAGIFHNPTKKWPSRAWF